MTASLSMTKYTIHILIDRSCIGAGVQPEVAERRLPWRVLLRRQQCGGLLVLAGEVPLLLRFFPPACPQEIARTFCRPAEPPWRWPRACAATRPDPRRIAMADTYSLAEIAARTAMLDVACSGSERRGRYRLDSLIRHYGAPASGRVLVLELIADCPQRDAMRR